MSIENFEWDENKNRENQVRHGVSFEEAQHVFADPHMIVLNQRLDPPRRSWETVDYSDNPELPDVEHVKIVDKAFLPPPEELVFKDSESEKITISLDKETVAFFKNKAQESGASYQKILRNLLREYVANHSK